MKGGISSAIGSWIGFLWNRMMNVSSVPDYCCKENGKYISTYRGTHFKCSKCGYEGLEPLDTHNIEKNETNTQRVFKDGE